MPGAELRRGLVYRVPTAGGKQYVALSRLASCLGVTGSNIVDLVAFRSGSVVEPFRTIVLVETGTVLRDDVVRIAGTGATLVVNDRVNLPLGAVDLHLHVSARGELFAVDWFGDLHSSCA